MSPQARETKAKLNYWDYTKTKKLLHSKETINKTKGKTKQNKQTKKRLTNEQNPRLLNTEKKVVVARRKVDGRGG